MNILWIGTGVMGAPMAKHLCDANHHIYAYNRTPEKAQQLEPDITCCDSIESCIDQVDAVFTMVGYPDDVREVYHKVISLAKPKTILVDMTTSSPTLAKELAAKAKERDLLMLDAPVTGGDIGAINGTLSIMVGGDFYTYEKMLPLFMQLGSTITYMGPSGSGMYAKLANQTVIAGNILGIAEAITFARSKGLDLTSMLSVITGGSAHSWQASNNGLKMIRKDYRPGFFVKHYLKDLTLIMKEKGNLPLTVVETATKAYEFLVEQGFEDKGTQAIIEYYLKKQVTK